MDKIKSPSSLFSIAAKALFQNQYPAFTQLPSHTQRTLAIKITNTFFSEAVELLEELFKLEVELREALDLKEGMVGIILRNTIFSWICDVREAKKGLNHITDCLTNQGQEKVNPTQVRWLAYFVECSKWVEDNIPFLKQEAEYPDRKNFLFSKFTYTRRINHIASAFNRYDPYD